jgi:hypothetical protein
MKALHSKLLIDKNSPKLNVLKSTAAGLCTLVNIFLLYSKKDFRKTFIKEIVQKFANFRQKPQLK